MLKAAICGVIAASTMSVGTVNAEVALSFGFTDLSGNYTAGDSTFRAAGRAISSGDVTRIGDGTALFNEGNLTGNGTPSFFLEMTVNNIDGVAKTADGSGVVRIRDIDGDEFRGTFSGVWLGTDFGFTFASSTGIDFEFDSSAGDGVFEGSTSGSFANFADGEFFSGAVSLLFLQSAANNFFANDFRVTNTEADGIILPAPAGTLALAGLGLVASRRRRS